MPTFRKISLITGLLALVVVLAGLAGAGPSVWRPAAVVAGVGIALGLGAVPAWKGYQFTLWIVAAVTASMIYPGAFLHWGGFDLRNKWLVLIVVQLVMFGMGTQMSLRDFRGIVRTPRGVLVGILCHFSVMPLVGFGLTRLFHFPPEIAAGVILIGSCSSGLASNVMAYLAGANLALSVTVTAVTTMLAPLFTPLWMKLLAGTLVHVDVVGMMMEIVKIVIVPIGAALLHDYLKHASQQGRSRVRGAAVLSVVWLVALALGGWTWLAGHCGDSGLLALSVVGFIAGAVVFGVAFHAVSSRVSWIPKVMPLASMAGIVFFTTVTTAAGRDSLLQVGVLLFVAAVLHNGAGYFFGYWLSRATGLERISARAVAFEVGLQNGGMATGLAGAMGKLGTVGLASAIFSPWMNVSGSVLANFWKRRPVRDGGDRG